MQAPDNQMEFHNKKTRSFTERAFVFTKIQVMLTTLFVFSKNKICH
jgi:hypothetical protein